MQNERFAAPQHLSPRSQALWAELVPHRARSIGRLALIEEALTALDRAGQAKAELAGGPLTTKTATTGTIHINPLVKVERECRQQFSRIWADLGLSFDSTEDGGTFAHWLKRQQQEAAR